MWSTCKMCNNKLTVWGKGYFCWISESQQIYTSLWVLAWLTLSKHIAFQTFLSKYPLIKSHHMYRVLTGCHLFQHHSVLIFPDRQNIHNLQQSTTRYPCLPIHWDCTAQHIHLLLYNFWTYQASLWRDLLHPWVMSLVECYQFSTWWRERMWVSFADYDMYGPHCVVMSTLPVILLPAFLETLHTGVIGSGRVNYTGQAEGPALH